MQDFSDGPSFVLPVDKLQTTVPSFKLDLPVKPQRDLTSTKWAFYVLSAPAPAMFSFGTFQRSVDFPPGSSSDSGAALSRGAQLHFVEKA